MVLAALLTGSLVTACSGGSAPASGATFVLGATVDLSGPLASYGKGFAAAWQGYFGALNAAGGIDGHKVQLVILDDASVPARATDNMRALLARKAILVSGITVSDTCALLAPSMAKAHVPELCTTIPSALAVSPPPYVFSMTDPETMWVHAITSIIASQVPAAAPRVATILPDVAGLHDMGEAFAADAAARSWTDVADATVPLSDLSAVQGPVATVLAARPDAVVTDIAPVGAVPMVQGLRAGGFTGPVIMGNPELSVLQKLKDPALFQVWPTQIVDTSSSEPAVRQMVDALAGQGVTDINSSDVPVDYLGAALVAKALTSCGSPCTGAALRNALAGTGLDLPGLTVGHFGFSSGSNVPQSAVDVYRWDSRRDAPELVLSQVAAVQPFPSS